MRRTKAIRFALRLLWLLALLPGLTLGAPAAVAQPAFSCAQASGLPLLECEALAALYTATGGPGWTVRDGWMQTPTPCTWHGVTCWGGRVVGLNLPRLGLSGALPAQIGSLTELMSLNLLYNQITTLPPQIGSLGKLYSLNLAGNQLAAVPAQIGSLSALGILDLGDNRLESLPPLTNLTQLWLLALENNRLAALPDGLGNLKKLSHLAVHTNQLTSLPGEIGGLAELEYLDASRNQLTSLPAEIGALHKLTTLWLVDNHLADLPVALWSLPRLNKLALSGNQLSALPGEISGLVSSLQILWLSDNQLTSLPSEIGDLFWLGFLYLDGNMLSTLPESMGNLDRVQRLTLAGNAFTSLPAALWDMDSLAYLFLDSNPLSGPMPASLTGLNLFEFAFHDTGWCAPAEGPLAVWLATRPILYGTGVLCDQPFAGGLTGRVTYPGGASAVGIQVSLYRALSLGRWQDLASAWTVSDGSYSFSGLGQGPGIDYRVQFVDPTHRFAAQYFYGAQSIQAAQRLTIPAGQWTTGVDAALTRAATPEAVVFTPFGGVTVNPIDGTSWISLPADSPSEVSVTQEVPCAGEADRNAVLLVRTPPGQEYPAAEVGSSRFRAVIPGGHLTGPARLTITAPCLEGDAPWVGEIHLFHPLGRVTDASSGRPIAGARVTLHLAPGWAPKTSPDDDRPFTCQSDLSRQPDEGWITAPPPVGSVISGPEMLPFTPALPIQNTTVAGSYGWDASPGCYFVTVQARGYAPQTSPLVGLPFVTGELNLALTHSGSLVYLPLVGLR
jgi:Leucine-rich repeat (LRR) protein